MKGLHVQTHTACIDRMLVNEYWFGYLEVIPFMSVSAIHQTIDGFSVLLGELLPLDTWRMGPIRLVESQKSRTFPIKPTMKVFFDFLYDFFVRIIAIGRLR